MLLCNVAFIFPSAQIVATAQELIFPSLICMISKEILRSHWLQGHMRVAPCLFSFHMSLTNLAKDTLELMMLLDKALQFQEKQLLHLKR